MRKLTSCVITAVLAATATVVTAAPAFAGTAPSCVTRDVMGSLHKVYLHNGCGQTMQLKVVIELGPDTGCYVFPSGSSKTLYWGSIGWYDKTVTCS